MIAQQLGFPFKKFIASNNANDVVIRYLNSNSYNPKPTIQTISNAMDVGNPSNFTRIMEIYENDYNKLSLIYVDTVFQIIKQKMLLMMYTKILVI